MVTELQAMTILRELKNKYPDEDDFEWVCNDYIIKTLAKENKYIKSEKSERTLLEYIMELNDKDLGRLHNMI